MSSPPRHKLGTEKSEKFYSLYYAGFTRSQLEEEKKKLHEEKGKVWNEIVKWAEALIKAKKIKRWSDHRTIETKFVTSGNAQGPVQKLEIRVDDYPNLFTQEELKAFREEYNAKVKEGDKLLDIWKLQQKMDELTSKLRSIEEALES